MGLPSTAPIHAQPRIRDAVVGDVPFLASTWKQSFKFDSPWANRIRWQAFSAGHGPVIQRLLERSATLVACDPEREEDILGYLVFEPAPKIVHYAYTKPSFRRAGVCRALLNASGLPADLAGVTITHATNKWFGSLEKRCKAQHDPYPAFR